ncbi:hypothetical protein LZ31DRAFT_597031 [Colletotrichum somersetense]|nr:hypothetical protein LZ31DRAFT_597031 [Colletotrichum somersetense]
MDRQATAVQSFGSTEAHNALVGNQFSGQTIITFQGRFDQSQKVEAGWKRLEREENERNDCLRSLAFREINARRHDILPAHPETCDWLFDTLEFRQ